MAAGDPGSPARYYSSIAVETALSGSIPAQAQGAANTAFIVASVSGFPSNYPYTLIVDPDTSKEEVVTVTAGSGTTLSVTRGSDNTQGVAHSAGAVVRHGVSGREFRESENHIAARGFDIDQTILDAAFQTHVHGIQTGDGVVVGTLKEQTLTRKTLTTPTINGATISGAFTSTATVTGGTFTSVTVTSSTISTSTFTGSFTASAATFVSPTISGSPVITGLSSAGMVNSSATPKIYVDSILGSATSAAISAASAAVSATSAATSATSAAASASASASSASAAATSASSALTSQTAAATSATSAAASATAAATSATSAAASATASASSASAAATSATSAAASATAAATSATSAAASATAAASSAGTAATSAGQAATSATSAATSATSAAASATAAATSATSAAASATTASNSAATATTQASNAATSATSAAASATAAATSATSAAASATSAAASYDSFDDRYLGAKSTPPTLDNDGNALLTGALYWNTAVNKMYVWSGTAWGEISSSADIIAYKYTVAAGATSVSGADDNSLTLTYTVGKEQVYINGVLQVRNSDYTATTGSSITGMAALTASDIVTVLAFTAFSVSNTYTQAEADAKFVQQTNNFFAGKNFIINGNMNIAQRGTSFAGMSSGAQYLVDRWELRNNNLGTFTISQDTDSPAGFKTCSKLLVTTADASPAASDFLFYRTKLEGQALQSLKYGSAGALTTNLSFWVKSNLTGTYIVYIDNANASGGSKAISKSYTINAADTWEKKTISIPGDTASAFNNDTSLGMGLNFSIGAGSDRTSGTLQTNWSSITNANTLVGQVNLAGTLNNYWQITGTQLEIGNVATEFQTATGTIQGELAACQRYYWRANTLQQIGASASTTIVDTVIIPPTMRQGASSHEISGGGVYSYAGGGAPSYTSGTWSIVSTGPSYSTLRYTHGSAVFTAGTVWQFNSTYFALSAEL
jgi:hypothetical protein